MNTDSGIHFLQAFSMEPDDMRKSTAQYIAQVKDALGLRSDREVAEHFGYSQPVIAKAKAGNMSDPFALEIAEVLGVDPGEILMVARMEREKDAKVRAALIAWASKTLALMPSITVPRELVAGGVKARREAAANWRKR